MVHERMALAGAAVLAMAGGTDAFMTGPQAYTPGARTAGKSLAVSRQAPGRMAPLAGLRMVAAKPQTDVAVSPTGLASAPAASAHRQSMMACPGSDPCCHLP